MQTTNTSCMLLLHATLGNGPPCNVTCSTHRVKRAMGTESRKQVNPTSQYLGAPGWMVTPDLAPRCSGDCRPYATTGWGHIAARPGIISGGRAFDNCRPPSGSITTPKRVVSSVSLAGRRIQPLPKSRPVASKLWTGPPPGVSPSSWLRWDRCGAEERPADGKQGGNPPDAARAGTNTPCATRGYHRPHMPGVVREPLSPRATGAENPSDRAGARIRMPSLETHTVGWAGRCIGWRPCKARTEPGRGRRAGRAGSRLGSTRGRHRLQRTCSQSSDTRRCLLEPPVRLLDLPRLGADETSGTGRVFFMSKSSGTPVTRRAHVHAAALLPATQKHPGAMAMIRARRSREGGAKRMVRRHGRRGTPGQFNQPRLWALRYATEAAELGSHRGQGRG